MVDRLGVSLYIINDRMVINNIGVHSMITELSKSKGSAVGFEITGKVSTKAEKEWLLKLDKLLEHHEKLNVLLLFGDNSNWETDAGIDDLKWLVKHMRRFNKIAIVTDKTIWKWLITIDSIFAKMVGINEEHFEKSEIEKAWKWLNT